MNKEYFECKCKSCANTVKKIDEKGRLRISCPFAPDIEYLYDWCPTPLKEGCMDYKRKVEEVK